MSLAECLCQRCGWRGTQLKKHLKTVRGYYRVVRCLRCGVARVEALNPGSPGLSLCPSLDAETWTCRAYGEPCPYGVVDGKGERVELA